MKLIKQDLSKGETDIDPRMFIGDVVRQQLANEENAKLLRVTSVTFRDGARNKLHHHASDQVLFVTHGQGIVATETEEFRIRPGDAILISEGERHWHGAEPGHDLTHLSILTPGPMTIDEE